MSIEDEIKAIETEITDMQEQYNIDDFELVDRYRKKYGGIKSDSLETVRKRLRQLVHNIVDERNFDRSMRGIV